MVPGSYCAIPYASASWASILSVLMPLSISGRTHFKGVFKTFREIRRVRKPDVKSNFRTTIICVF